MDSSSDESEELSSCSSDINDNEMYELNGILRDLYKFHNSGLSEKSKERIKINVVYGNDRNDEHDRNDVNKYECPHKSVQCKIISPCCGMAFSCSRCHDEYYSDKKNVHVIDRTKIVRIVCMNCIEYQDISNHCTKCNISFAKYYCDICKVFDGNSNNYHCDKCKLCIEGNRNNFVHCDTCRCCMEKNHFVSHKCVPDVLEGSCSVCIDSLKNGEKLFLVTCGHALHIECYNSLMNTSYKCPICSKTIKDMKYQFSLLDDDIKNQPMPKIKIIQIKCNDCDNISNTNYHYLGTKCTNCGSYNTYEQRFKIK
jgi:RING finger/CHY zinc finger protein 1